ncbi:TonB-dependent receptor [Chitinimonas arctica]|uniref:TonB-dependent receptor n=1 Tax=Chitinimonas arctica TaxID=2594795 RepID=A0A516SDB4_9NEIS|nr:TonB-dependent receptor [Chitinimonas arctica]QDQ26130.1 TonB-dependent receptor [Chitinimonas arctica]
MQLTKIAQAVLALGAGITLAFAADAQPPVEKIEVTGSNIKRVNRETVSPVTSYNREDIARSGATSVIDVMRKLTAAGGNGGEATGAGSFRNGASNVELRQLPTLVLLNGFRLPSSGSDSYNGQTSVDLNSIPLAAIERIDVLKDGASAIYGTDAVGGVVNFILRKDFKGLELSSSYGKTTHGDGDTAKAAISGGFGDRAEQKFNVSYTLSFENRKAINAADRDWTRSKTGDFRDKPGGLIQGGVYGAKGTDPGTLSLGGSQRMPDPECAADHIRPYPNAPEWGASPTRNACFYTQAEGEELLHPQTRYSGLITGNWDITDNLTAYGHLFYNNFDSKILGNPAWIQNRDRSNVLLVSKDNTAINPYGVDVRVRRLFQSEEGGIHSKVKTTWMVGGLKSQLGDWELEGSVGSGTEKGHIRTLGTFMHDKLHDYLEAGKYNPFGSNKNSAQTIDELRADHAVRTKSQTEFFNVKGTTEFGQLPGGAIGVAVGAEFKRDKLSYDPTQAWRKGEIGIYSQLMGINGSQRQSAAFTEFSLPILKNLEAQLAVRYDHYEFAGNTTNPKVGLRWTPTPSLLLRTTYSTGFRAPTLSQTFNEGRGGFASARDPKRCLTGNEFFDLDCSASVLSLVTGTKTIKPEKSKNFNLGFVFEPVKDVNIGMTYWRISWKDRIEELDSESVLAGEDGPYKGNVVRYPVTTEDQEKYDALTPAEKNSIGPLVGALKEVKIGLINRSKVFTDGIDVDGSITMRTREAGKFKLLAEGTYLSRQNSSKLPDDPSINCANNTSCEAGEYQTPRVRAKLGLNWEKGPWATTSSVNYVSSYRMDRTVSITNNVQYSHYDEGVSLTSSTTFDASVSYTGIKDLTLRLGADNLFDRDPPFNPSNNMGFDKDLGDTRGRYIYGTLNYKFK